MALELRERTEELRLFPLRQAREQRDDPALVRARHLGEGAAARFRERDGERAAITAHGVPSDETCRFQFVGDARDVAAGDHHALGDLSHLQARRIALELRHEIEPGQRRVELPAKASPDLLLDEIRARQDAQPEAERLVVVAVRSRFVVERLEALHPASSPPSTAIAWPVTPSEPGRHSHATAAATSSGWTNAPRGVSLRSTLRASA